MHGRWNSIFLSKGYQNVDTLIEIRYYILYAINMLIVQSKEIRNRFSEFFYHFKCHSLYNFTRVWVDKNGGCQAILFRCSHFVFEVRIDSRWWILVVDSPRCCLNSGLIHRMCILITKSHFHSEIKTLDPTFDIKYYLRFFLLKIHNI